MGGCGQRCLVVATDNDRGLDIMRSSVLITAMQESEFLLGFGGICDSELSEIMRKDCAAVDICLYCLLDTIDAFFFPGDRAREDQICLTSIKPEFTGGSLPTAKQPQRKPVSDSYTLHVTLRLGLSGRNHPEHDPNIVLDVIPPRRKYFSFNGSVERQNRAVVEAQ
jgi:hypothetical protein